MSEAITDEFEKRQAEKPDKYTLAWWNSQYAEVHKAVRGATHAIHLALADNEDLGKSLREALGRIASLETAAEGDRAKIGELQAKLAEHQERLDRQGEFLEKLRKNGK